MRYKDLVYKITSGGNNAGTLPSQELKKETPEVNAAKKSVANKDVLIGVMIGEEITLNKGIAGALKREVERTLTVLFDSPISDSFSFLPFDNKTLLAMLELFPDRNHHYVAKKEDFTGAKELKQTKMNLSAVYSSDNVADEFSNKIDYLVTINVEKLEPSMEAKLKEKKVMIFPMMFRGTEQFSQPEKHVEPDPSGWKYNSASGMWLKTWGKDGQQEIPSWKAPDDWNLDTSPEYKVF